MNINNTADFRKLLVYNRLGEAKKFCEETCGMGVTQTAILSSFKDVNAANIYDDFLAVLSILAPEDDRKNLEYSLSLRESVGKMFQEKYSISDITPATIKDTYFLFKEVPKYLNSVPLTDPFFKSLWSCLKNYGIDDERIGMAWVAAINLSKS